MVDQSIVIFRGLTFGPFVVEVLDINGNPYVLTDWVPHAEVKNSPNGVQQMDLFPVIFETTKVKMQVAHSITTSVPEGHYYWDLVLVTPIGERLGPFIGGAAQVKTPITDL
jgi:hypothetical protein